jgi:hypothetical protein
MILGAAAASYERATPVKELRRAEEFLSTEWLRKATLQLCKATPIEPCLGRELKRRALEEGEDREVPGSPIAAPAVHLLVLEGGAGIVQPG